jgi:hypothetical protein
MDYIYFAQAGLKKRLKDPDSAQFRNTYLSRKSGTPVTCGEVNSKNSFGGYSGFKLFLGMRDIVVLEVLSQILSVGVADPVGGVVRQPARRTVRPV